MKLNFGCGSDIRKGYVNVDIIHADDVDLVHDLNKIPLPFKENSASEILLHNILEHVQNPFDFLMDLWRIAKPGAKIKISTPHFSSGNAWGDLQHVKPFSKKAFENQNIQDKFKVINCIIEFPRWLWPFKWIFNKFSGFYEYHLAYLINSNDLYIELEVSK